LRTAALRAQESSAQDEPEGLDSYGQRNIRGFGGCDAIRLLADGSLDAAFVSNTLAPEVAAQENGLRILTYVGDHVSYPTVGVAVDPTHLAPDDPAVLALVRANRRALRTIHDEPDLAVRYVNDIIGSITESEARQHYERYVAPYFTVDGRHDPSVAAQAVPAVAKELGVSTVPDLADIYRTEPPEEIAA
jgi:ABC-type nitrate/sulfonate/bicarbonate transport system substrate-binding protein